MICTRPICACALVLMLVAPLAADVVEEARLTARSPIQSDILGYDVAFDGTTIVGGAPFGAPGNVQQSGRAFIYRRDANGQWQQQRLDPPQRQISGWFGIAVAVDGDTVAIGAQGEWVSGVDRAGSVYMYDFDANDNQWNLSQQLTLEDPRPIDFFGTSVALSGDTLVVGANGFDIGDLSVGAAFVFERIEGQWILSAQITAPEPGLFDNFGFVADLDGQLAVIGAMRADTNGQEDSGAAYVVRKIDGDWQIQQLHPSVVEANARFGDGVAVRGDEIVVGSPREGGFGAAYVFRPDGTTWVETARLVDPSPVAGERFGEDVSVDGDAILVGAFLKTLNDIGGAGTAHLFHRTAGQWQHVTQIEPSDRDRLSFGWTLEMRGDEAVIAAPFYRLNQGALYVFSGLSPCNSCDMNCDGDVNAFDVEPFLELLFGGEPCQACTGDVNGDGEIDAFDIEPFLNCLFP